MSSEMIKGNMITKWGFIKIVIILLLPIFSSGCLSETNEKTMKVTMYIDSVRDDMTINYCLYYIKSNVVVEELINFTSEFTKTMGQARSYEVPKRDYEMYFTFQTFNNSNQNEPAVFEERYINITSDQINFEISSVGLEYSPNIYYWEGHGVP